MNSNHQMCNARRKKERHVF